MVTKAVTVLIPGLLGIPGLDSNYIVNRISPLPGLSALLAGSRRHRISHADATGFSRHFGLSRTRLPVAALGCISDALHEMPHDRVLRADPVCLIADRDVLRLTGAFRLLPTFDEAYQLAEAFNETWQGSGYRLTVAAAARWYLQTPRCFDIQTTPPLQALNRPLTHIMPAGGDAREVHILMNEVQMLLHEHPVNQQREAQGLPTINSIWLWGEGDLADLHPYYQGSVYANDPTLRGLATLAGATIGKVPPDPLDVLDGEIPRQCLLELDALKLPSAYADIDAWLEMLVKLERDWFLVLADWQKKTGVRIELDAGTGVVFRPASWLAKCFTRSKTLQAYL